MPSELDTFLKEMSDIKDFVVKRVEGHEKVTKEELERLTRAYTDVANKIAALERARAARITDGKLTVPNGRLTGFSPLDLYILRSLLQDKYGKIVLPNLHNAVVEQQKGLRQMMTPDAILAWDDWAKRIMGARTPHDWSLSEFKGAVGQWTRDMMGQYAKALDSTTAAAGDELVPTFEAAELWMDVNLETQVLPLLPQSPMPTNPFDHPIQFGDTNWYPAVENVQVTTTDLATQKVTLTAYGLKTGVAFSDELNEDAVIALVPELRSSLVRNAAEVIDDVLLNGDTTTADGINSSGATIAKSTAGKAHFLLGFDGLIHLPLVDNTPQASDRNAAIGAASYIKAMGLLAKYSTPRRQNEVVFVSDVRTHIAALNLAEVVTMDKFGARATISTGELAQVFGVPYIRSAQMRLAQTSGRVANTAAANTTGRVLCINTTQWRVGFRRGITLENDREPGKGQTTMYVSFRIALTERSGTRSSASHTSLAYDITGV